MVMAGGCHAATNNCDTCNSAVAALFCRQDMALLCLTCDSRIHRNDTEFSQRHDRVWLCEVCEQAPASVTCSADAAALCFSCDADIHAANDLASRHDRVPVEPFFDAAESMGRSDSLGLMLPSAKTEEAAWLSPNLNHMKEMEFLLDLEFGNVGVDRFHSPAMDRITPVHTDPVVPALVNIDFCRSNLSSFCYFPPSLTQSVNIASPWHDPNRPSHSQASWCSLDVGVVPEDALSNNSSDRSVTSQPTPLCRTERQSRVLRYREKRKNRKFEKIIRYASRKAYAETRPRIKGRFSKRSETETETDSDMDNYFFSQAVLM